MPVRAADTLPRLKLTALVVALPLGLSACADMSPTTRSTLTGAGLGAAGGALIGSFSGNAGWGALAGAAVGGAGGYLYSRTRR